MPMLADLDDPPKSRLPGLLLGLLVALPIAGVFFAWLLPSMIAAVVGGSRDLDDRLRAKDAYLAVLCETAMDPERDAELCGCVLAMDYPSLDCREPFNQWALQRQAEACADPSVKEGSLSFCTCVQTVHERVQEAADQDAQRRVAQDYESCEGLDDALALPRVEASGTST